MEMTSMNLSLLGLICLAAVVTVDSQQESPDWLAKSLRAANREKRTHKKNQRNSIDAGTSNLIDSAARDSCCLNGGLCIMNTFCHCKKNFYGRYCEHRVRHRSCGTIRHGTWMASGCHLCHCFDGQMTCKVTTINGCEHLSYIEGYENDPDYMVGMDKKVEDYDKFYDDYEYPSAADSSISGTSRRDIAVWTLLMAFVVAARNDVS